MLKLVIEDDEGKQTVVPLIRDEITIGRKEGNTIRLTERNVSRRHARLTKVDGNIYVETVEARYGIKLNGKKIASRSKISTGDEVLIGDYKLTVQDESKKAEDSTHLRNLQQLEAQAGPRPIPINEQARLVVISSNFAGQEFQIARTEVVIGRNPDNDIIIDHRSISGNHARIVQAPNKIFKVTDLESSNGIRVNGQPFTSRELNSGDIVDLGHVRVRFCAPGELWSFQLAAGLVDEISPASNRNSLILLLAVIAVLVLGVAVFFMMQGPADPKPTEAAPTAATGPAAPIITVRTPVEDLILTCEDLASKGDFAEALEVCREATEKDPANKLAAVKYDKVTEELALKKQYDNAKELVSHAIRQDCESALIEIDSISDPNSWAARQIFQEGLRAAALKCVEDAIVADAEAAIASKSFDTADTSIAELKQQFPTSVSLTRLEDRLQRAMKKPEIKEPRDPKDSSKPVIKDPVIKDPVIKDPKAKVDIEAAKAKVEEARRLLMSNPNRAAELYAEALAADSGNAPWRASYAFALERAGKTCKAYEEYKRAARGLSGAAKEKAEQKVENFKSQCEK